MKSPKILSDPRLAALCAAILFFLLHLVIFRPGYAAPLNDDLKMIWIVAGYPGGKPFPFLVYSNVLLGSALMPLYALPTDINWEILFFVLLNFLSVWALLYVVLSQPLPASHRFVAAAIVLACDSYFLLNLTYSTIAGVAAIAGASLALETLRRVRRFCATMLTCGLALILMGSLIRIGMLPLVLSVASPALLLIYRLFDLRKLAASLAIAGVLVGGFYAADRLYLRSNPDWRAYITYNTTRQRLHDTHLLENLHSEIRWVGWSKNDQELFARWFLADAKVYSLGHLKYLVDHVPGYSLDPRSVAAEFGASLIGISSLPYVLMLLAIWLWALAHGQLRRAALPLAALLPVFLIDNLYLAWAWKIADHIVLSSLAATAIFSVLVLGWIYSEAPASPVPSPAPLRRAARYASLLLLVSAVGLVLYQAVVSSDLHAKEQAGYRNILSDLRSLQEEGKLPPDALIVAVTHGIPLEWSDPFTMEFPSVKYLDMGWFTWAPAYDRVLEQYGIQSLPDALYQKENVYLLTRPSFTDFLARYYQEHEGRSVSFQSFYVMPNEYNLGGYDDVRLYRVSSAN